MAILFTLRVCARNLLREEVAEEIFSYFVLLEMSDLGLNRGLTCNKPINYLISYGLQRKNLLRRKKKKQNNKFGNPWDKAVR